MRTRRVRPIDLAGNDPAAETVLALQRAAYAVEASLIGSSAIPALTESLEDLRHADEAWLGCFESDGDSDSAGLDGAISWRVLDDGTVDICRLVVAPPAFRHGVASALLDALDRRFPARRMVVSTGSANAPAMELYRRRGFRPVRQWNAAPGLQVTELERPLSSD